MVELILSASNEVGAVVAVGAWKCRGVFARDKGLGCAGDMKLNCQKKTFLWVSNTITMVL